MSDTDLKYKDISFVYTRSYWVQNTIQTFIYLSLSLYTVCKLRGNLIPKNYAIIFTFLTFELFRNFYQAYYFFNITGQGNKKFISDADNFNNGTELTEFDQLFYNICDCVLNLFFYNIILKMINFWDQLFYDNIFHSMKIEKDEYK
mgnify:FL=1